MIAIPNMEKPKDCEVCPFFVLDGAITDDNEWVSYSVCDLLSKTIVDADMMNDCPLTEIDHTNTELLEFFNEFKKWKASKEVAKYIKAVYGERRTEQSQINTIENTNEIQPKGEADE